MFHVMIMFLRVLIRVIVLGSYITTLDVFWIGTCEWDSCTAAERGGWTDLADVCWYTYNGYCDWCSYEDCYCVWGACWRHTDNWPHAAYSVGVYKYVIESYPLSQLWDNVPGYFCNSEGIMGGVWRGHFLRIVNPELEHVSVQVIILRIVVFPTEAIRVVHLVGC